ncbi:copper homeostasis protein CutC [Otariodibacter oris]|uniref:PF03932 family protein CutC n=1 Tax=Otariodibacter oris TaxID=1032623 RepID=A0A420XJY1_9PAST|nr:copper homeostasis protein CutC [Otariodibacter oris]QGM80454.1 copper homeostasis protein CutC [Otariodibacter oris]RKR77400.1 copper homeostasis protein [Otariodibacter oris]
MPKIEVCVDNLESVITANQYPIDRIELCSALSVGGITPNYGLLKQAVAISNIPIAVMIRPRAGDFIFSESEIQAMITDIEMALACGIKNIVIGALTPSAQVDIQTIKRLLIVAQGMKVTFHRAFDLCDDPFVALSQLIDLGCDRILTSGQAKTAFEGIPLLQQLVNKAQNQIQIMAGCGINADNVSEIIQRTQVPQIHFSAKGERWSTMRQSNQVSMGNDNSEQDRKLTVLDHQKLSAILHQIRTSNRT